MARLGTALLRIHLDTLRVQGSGPREGGPGLTDQPHVQLRAQKHERQTGAKRVEAGSPLGP